MLGAFAMVISYIRGIGGHYENSLLSHQVWKPPHRLTNESSPALYGKGSLALRISRGTLLSCEPSSIRSVRLKARSAAMSFCGDACTVPPDTTQNLLRVLKVRRPGLNWANVSSTSFTALSRRTVIETFRQLLAKAALVFRPWRGYACHAGISDKLPHVLVAVNDQAEIDGIGCSASLEKLNPSLQLFGGFLGPRVARSI